MPASSPTQSSPTKAELQALVTFACSLADIAAEVTLQYFRQLQNVDNKMEDGKFDPVTIADREAEAKMRTSIEKHYPTHGVLGEEHGAKAGSEDLTWVLDPIDGTRAFISGIPVWGTLIALFDGEQPILGVMDQPFTDERFVASGNQSKYFHKNSESVLSTRDCKTLDNAVMMSTAPDAYCMLAGGHIDLVVEADLKPFDIQALIPIVKNAGGVVTDWQGGSAVNGGQVIAAATPALHAQALKLLT